MLRKKNEEKLLDTETSFRIVFLISSICARAYLIVVGNNSGVYRNKVPKPKEMPNLPRSDTVKIMLCKPGNPARKKRMKEKLRQHCTNV